jgi:sugar/nucleoside kinase (ribokinase family)
MRSFDCIVIGDVLFDIMASADCNEVRFVKGGTSYCQCSGIFPGGAGNIATGIAKLGGNTAFIGKAGNDSFGKSYSDSLRKSGVASKIFFDKKKPTGVAISFVGENERTFLVFRGANDNLMPREVEQTERLITSSRFLYLSGYSLVNNPQRNAILRAVEVAKLAKVKIVFDPGAHNLIKSNPRLFEKILDSCDVVSMNLEEAMALTNSKNLDDAICKFRNRPTLFALRHGEHGSIIFDNKIIVRTSAFEAKAKDTTGAGDAFTSALIFGLSRKLPLEIVGRLANWFASEVVRNVGARSFPKQSQIDHFLRTVAKTFHLE